MPTTPLKEARARVQDAINALETAHRTWGECVTALHMAELQLRTAQRDMRGAFEMLTDALNGNA